MKRNHYILVTFGILGALGISLVLSSGFKGNEKQFLEDQVRVTDGAYQEFADTGEIQMDRGKNGYGIGINGKGGGQRQDMHEGNCLGDECLAFQDLEYPIEIATDNVIEALNLAIQDEYAAFTTYQAVINEFGAVRPFSMIIRAEEQHINALKALFDRYGIAVPEPNEITLSVEDSMAKMCTVGVEAEIANVALYQERLLPTVQEHEDITFVFTNLMNASQNKHLPAFERCSN